MCTATCWSGIDGYELFFNRDELKSRATGQPPRIFTGDGGVRFAAPIDATAGGTWIFVNEGGLTGCLINQYPAHALDPGPRRRSRGLLLKDLAGSADPAAAESRLRQTDLSRYEGFLIILVAPGQPALSVRWDTFSLTTEADAGNAQPFTSSRHESDTVLRSRRRRFSELIRLRNGDPTPDDLRAFHEHHAPASASHSVFMSRHDAETVSLAHVVVEPGRVLMEYAPRLPGALRFGPATLLSLPRAASTALHVIG